MLVPPVGPVGEVNVTSNASRAASATIESPMPLRSGSEVQYRSKTSAWWAAGMPGPSSLMVTVAWDSLSVDTETRTSPPSGECRVGERIRPGGVFALWSDQPDDTFLATARAVFASCDAHEVRFPNHHTGGEATNTIYLARTAS